MTTAPISTFRGKYRFLSNFAGPDEGCTNGVIFDGVLYPTSEHAYQAAKFVHAPKIQAWILEQARPARTKYIAKTLADRIRPDWLEVNLSVMAEILRSKFERNPELAKALVATNDAELIEGNTWGDVFWGVCNGVGENHLGRLLMELRTRLRAADPGPRPTHD